MRCVLVLLTIICVVGCRSQWTDPTTGVQLEYKIVDDHVAIGYGQSSDDRAIDPKFEGHITMPKDVDGLPVTAVSDYAFYGCHLTSVTLPPCLRTIGRNAFLHSDITQITFPDSKVTIDSRAFDGCQRLFFLKLPSNVDVKNEAFSYCYNLHTLVLADGVTLSPDSFRKCERLKNVVFPKSCRVSDKAFPDSKGVQCVFVPKGTHNNWAKNNLFAKVASDYLVMVEYESTEVADWAKFVNVKSNRQMEFRRMFDEINDAIATEDFGKAYELIKKWQEEYLDFVLLELNGFGDGMNEVISIAKVEHELRDVVAQKEKRDKEKQEWLARQEKERLEYERALNEKTRRLNELQSQVRDAIKENDFRAAETCLSEGRKMYPDDRSFGAELRDEIAIAEAAMIEKSVREAIEAGHLEKASTLIGDGRQRVSRAEWKQCLVQETLNTLDEFDELLQKRKFDDFFAKAMRDNSSETDIDNIGVQFVVGKLAGLRLGASQETALKLLTDAKLDRHLIGGLLVYKGRLRVPYREFKDVELLFNRHMGLVAVMLKAELKLGTVGDWKDEYNTIKRQLEKKFSISFGPAERTEFDPDSLVWVDITDLTWESSRIPPKILEGLVKTRGDFLSCYLRKDNRQKWPIEQIIFRKQHGRNMVIALYSPFLDAVGNVLWGEREKKHHQLKTGDEGLDVL